MPLLELDCITQAYGDHVVVRDLSLSLEPGQIACLLGASGCGKTTALRCIAGFEPVQRGHIRLEGQEVSGSVHVPPENRQIGMVFQDYALFPHLSVLDNIGFGMGNATRKERQARVEELLERIGLTGQGHKYPHQLSGGQQQRVALARALAPQPRLILMDEPFSNLDVELRERLSVEVRDVLKAMGTTAILVTHDQHEAFAVADMVGVMRDGRIEQWDTPYRLYHCPATRYVADFIGQGVLLPGEVAGPEMVRMELGLLHSDLPLECNAECMACGKNCHLDILLRPDDVIHDDEAPIRAEVVHKAFKGAEFLYTLRLPSGRQVLSLAPSHHDHALGEKIGIRLDVDHVVAFLTQP
ncbi:ABC transporter ATP-binding protein [Denitratisoma oestradiolicum]|uniref:Spermidine/putrescine import ATP-binding protein PotA 2 n=1 Tax=Denitratisoma oestradiolicum TaxID=311182 RepID=A0A6S6XS72_9PROT|nr:ABC transporter ATP-binding protein [Denitratisoma oestradiolicum]TWO82300.1 ABC transporter ATP-binding protein [Denitratisoma oestradiolicum]CAB1368831.1 Spermidine/putrescine import ATP-binding protein PotA 2 [Denitratisoma oestradiolicum]